MITSTYFSTNLMCIYPSSPESSIPIVMSVEDSRSILHLLLQRGLSFHTFLKTGITEKAFRSIGISVREDLGETPLDYLPDATARIPSLSRLRAWANKNEDRVKEDLKRILAIKLAFMGQQGFFNPDHDPNLDSGIDKEFLILPDFLEDGLITTVPGTMMFYSEVYYLMNRYVRKGVISELDSICIITLFNRWILTHPFWVPNHLFPEFILSEISFSSPYVPNPKWSIAKSGAHLELDFSYAPPGLNVFQIPLRQAQKTKERTSRRWSDLVFPAFEGKLPYSRVDLLNPQADLWKAPGKLGVEGLILFDAILPYSDKVYKHVSLSTCMSVFLYNMFYSEIDSNEKVMELFEYMFGFLFSGKASHLSDSMRTVFNRAAKILIADYKTGHPLKNLLKEIFLDKYKGKPKPISDLLAHRFLNRLTMSWEEILVSDSPVKKPYDLYVKGLTDQRIFDKSLFDQALSIAPEGLRNDLQWLVDNLPVVEISIRGFWGVDKKGAVGILKSKQDLLFQNLDDNFGENWMNSCHMRSESGMAQNPLKKLPQGISPQLREVIEGYISLSFEEFSRKALELLESTPYQNSVVEVLPSQKPLGDLISQLREGVLDGGEPSLTVWTLSKNNTLSRYSRNVEILRFPSNFTNYLEELAKLMPVVRYNLDKERGSQPKLSQIPSDIASLTTETTLSREEAYSVLNTQYAQKCARNFSFKAYLK